MTSELPQGRSHFALRDPRPSPEREITVYTYRPEAWVADAPILIVMHGRKRNGEEYRDQWAETAERHGFLLVVPEFNEAQYPPPHEYNYGAMVDRDGLMRPRAEWLFPAIDEAFREVRRRARSTREGYILYGHSAGGQLVHRLSTFAWPPSMERAVSANAGSYTMPSAEEGFPFGIGGTGLGDEALRAFLARPLLVMLGDRDVDPQDAHLPREQGAMRQGPHRFARGHRYLEVAAREAKRLGVPLAWRIAVAPGVAHDNHAMAPHVARELFGG
ncbi:MAG TPA: hypothetical protein VH301_04970 [Usitatibacter sp.]|jgi:poly(3-hydroxybutyrate) depolymerase|nr:hypothetical protein [Usitatibacter sp.]